MGKFLWKQRLHSLNRPEGPLVKHLAQFQRLLAEQGYPEDSSRRHLRLIADFSVWLKAKRISLDQVTHESVQRYLRCRARYRRRRKGNSEALRKILELLQQNGLVKKDTFVAQTPVEQLVSGRNGALAGRD
jgi:site-specific recombinase XerD